MINVLVWAALILLVSGLAIFFNDQVGSYERSGAHR